MRLRNTPEAYGEVAKWLHWIIALLFLGAYCAVYYRHWFTGKDTPANWNALQLHLSFGVTIGVFVFLRVLWKLSNPTPRLEPAARWEHIAAKAGHAALYFFMIAMPVTGYLGTGADTHYFFLLQLPKFEDTALYDGLVTGLLGISFEQFEKPIFLSQGYRRCVAGLDTDRHTRVRRAVSSLRQARQDVKENVAWD